MTHSAPAGLVERSGLARFHTLSPLLLAAVALFFAACARNGAEAVAPRADVELFTREGCPRCEEAGRWLTSLRARRRDVTIATTELGAHPAGRARLRAVAERAGTAAVSVPAFWVRGRLVVGFAGPAATGARVEALLAGASAPGALPGDDGAGTCSVEPTAPCGDAAVAPAGDEVTLPVFGVEIPEADYPRLATLEGCVAYLVARAPR